MADNFDLAENNKRMKNLFKDGKTLLDLAKEKPTDIWTNSQNWKPKPVCWNGNKNCHHQPAPRGSKTGTQGRKGSYERSKIPNELCRELIGSAFT
jgi:hypothetical protein